MPPQTPFSSIPGSRLFFRTISTAELLPLRLKFPFPSFKAYILYYRNSHRGFEDSADDIISHQGPKNPVRGTLPDLPPTSILSNLGYRSIKQCKFLSFSTISAVLCIEYIHHWKELLVEISPV